MVEAVVAEDVGQAITEGVGEVERQPEVGVAGLEAERVGADARREAGVAQQPREAAAGVEVAAGRRKAWARRPIRCVAAGA